MDYRVVLPYFSSVDRRHYRISQYANCLWAMPALNESVNVEYNNSLIQSRLPKPIGIANDNGLLSSFFMINDHLFLVLDTDDLMANSNKWIPHYCHFVSAIFICVMRTSIVHLFDNCGVPIFVMPNKAGAYLPLATMENYPIPPKDIPVFFVGRFETRKSRKFDAARILNHFPDSYIINTLHGRIPGKTYLRLMSRSKIAWCPRSVKAPPNYECNASTGKEYEAMGLECAVLKPPLGTIEVENREPGVHFIEYANNSSDLIDKIQFYLEHDNEREEIARNGKLWYDRNCTLTARAQWIFSKCLEAMRV